VEKQHILFDLDDTLVHCNKYFNQTIDQFAVLMESWFSDYRISAEEFKQKQLELDLAGVHIHGFLKERFPQSLLETYQVYAEQTGRTENLEEMDLLDEMGHAVYDQDYEAYPDMEKTLQKLKDEGHELSLYTGGDAVVQSVKIEQLGLSRYFGRRVYISQHKTTKVLEGIIVENKLNRKKTWMVGNSARTDVLPALETGIHAIYIPVENEWEFNMVDINVEPKGAFITLDSLIEVPDAVKKYWL
jgi:putative hydrolase of the HAD superfamily